MVFVTLSVRQIFLCNLGFGGAYVQLLVLHGYFQLQYWEKIVGTEQGEQVGIANALTLNCYVI
jgi:hypothetical protein